MIDSKTYFSGNIKAQHPVLFIKCLQHKYEHYQNFEDFIRNQLTDDALLWFTNKESKLDDMEEFTEKVLELFSETIITASHQNRAI